MRLGIDVSTYFEEEAASATYYDGEAVVEPLSLFNRNGVDVMRIRIWDNPYDGDKPYLGGTCDLNNFIRLAKLGVKKGYDIMLDIHYSDFWVDPAKQTIPKAWAHLSKEELETAVYDYTVKVLTEIKKEGIPLSYIQVGNEITNGMLWPYGKLTDDKPRKNYETFIKYIKAGVKGCREVYPNAGIVLHLERSYDVEVYDEFFTHMQKANVDYDIIGFSYYSYWHGTFEQFFKNVEACKKFNKTLMVVETGYAFTLEDYIKEGNSAGLVIHGDNLNAFGFKQEFPMTPDGQAEYVKAFLEACKQHGISCVIWWEPLWIPRNGICWASVEGEKYIGEEGKPTRNEWANQCMFDYEGRKLPAFDAFKVEK